jgi:hypothetical protein
MKHIVIFLLVIVFLQSCRKDKIHPADLGNNVAYSFFVAGHTYGSTVNFTGGLYQPFKNKFEWMNNDSLIELGILTGDIVKYSTAGNWDLVDQDLSILNTEVHFAAGNHDVEDVDLYQSRYGDTYFSFYKNKDLFIILDGNIDSWRITGDQLEFFKLEIAKLTSKGQNLYIFSHQAIYFDEHPITTNSLEGKSDDLNFKTEILPLLKELNNEVYLFVGDVGAFDWGLPAFYEKDDNVSYIASGMGGGLQDNFIVVDVSENGNVSYRLIALNGNDINAMGNLEDY